MSVAVEYTEEEQCPFSGEWLKQVVSRTIDWCGISSLSEKTVEMNVVSVSEERIRELNQQYRGKDVVTDVLSFSEYVGRQAIVDESAERVFLGEIFFCPAFIGRAAEEDDVTFERELAYVLSHGVLHLAGFDHEEEMFVIQERVTDFFTGNKEKK